MTEAEFKAAVKPIVSEWPTPERKLALAAVWFEAFSAGIKPERLAQLAREVLYETPDKPENRAVN